MDVKALIFSTTVALITISSFVQDKEDSKSLIEQLHKIDRTPLEITFQNPSKFINEGGHVQGIQKLVFRQSDYYILTGSSDEYSYYTILKSTPGENIVISNRHILEKPFKHAGGFQIFEDLMAVGVEDNDKKNRSKVFIFEIDNPENPPVEPLLVIDRYGTQKRGTAGCVAIAETEDKVILIVGDWDTVNLDFYVINRALLGEDPNAIILEYSLNSKNMDKSDWINPEWLAYQSINLILDDSGKIFLASMGVNSLGEDILDIFEMKSTNLKSFGLRKISSQNFGSNSTTTFRWGAGVFISDENKIQILATPEKIGDSTTIHIYE